MKIKIFRPIWVSLIMCMIWRCAAIAPPKGGPEDTTPPDIISVDPPSGTIHLDTRKIEIIFSEYMDESGIEKGIHVAPVLEEEVQIQSSGEKITVILPDQLPKDKTIVLTLGRDVKDEHGVELARPVQLAYSTGSNIDNGEITGRVYADGSSVVYLWQVGFEDQNDTLLLSSPDYSSETDDNGQFHFSFLAEGIYQILALERTAGGFVLDQRRMAYGVNSAPSIQLDSLVTNIRIQLHKENEPLRLLSAEWSGLNWGQLHFSNKPDVEFYEKNTVFIDDLPLKVFKHPREDNSLILLTENNQKVQPGKREIQVIQMNPVNTEITDTTSISVVVSSEIDTSYLSILGLEKKLTVTPDKSGPPLELVFSRPLENNFIDSLKIELTVDDSIQVPFIITKSSPMKIQLIPGDQWKPKEEYTLKLFQHITENSLETFKDSVRTVKISTTKPLGYGGLMGTVTGKSSPDLKSIITEVEKPEWTFKSFVNSYGHFVYTDIPEGYYTLLVYEDKDGNNTYSFGKAYPFQPSEWFYVLPDTIEIRANWDIELQQIHVGE